MPEINLVAVGMSGVAGMVVGFVWYSKKFFGDMWIKEIGFTEEQREKARKGGMTQQVVLGFLAELAMAFAFGMLVVLTGANPLLVGALVFFFALPIFLGQVLWQRKSWTLFAINTGHRLTEMAIFALAFYLF